MELLLAWRMASEVAQHSIPVLVYRVREMLSVLFILGADHQYHMSDGNGMGGRMCKQRSPSVLQKPLVIIRISLSDP